MTKYDQAMYMRYRADDDEVNVPGESASLRKVARSPDVALTRYRSLLVPLTQIKPRYRVHRLSRSCIFNFRLPR